MTLLERAIRNGQARSNILQLLQEHAPKQPVHATLKGLVHHGRHAGSGFVARNLREQVSIVLLPNDGNRHTMALCGDDRKYQTTTAAQQCIFL